MSQRRPSPTEAEWNRHRPQIERLYHSGTLDDLIRTMEGVGFFATHAMYKKKLRDWNVRKNVPAELALEAARKRAQREDEGRVSSTITINGKHVSADKIDRHAKRRKALGDGPEDGRRGALAMQGSGAGAAAVVVRTPESTEVYVATPVNPTPTQDPLFPRAPAPPVHLSGPSSTNSGTRGSNAAANPEPYTAPGMVPSYYPPPDDIFGFNLTNYNYFSPDIFATVNFDSPTLDPGVGAFATLPENLPKKRQPIHQAAQNGHAKIVERILQTRRDCLDMEGEEGETPLFLAAQQGHIDIVRVLLKAGADPNRFTFKMRRGPIHQASQGGHLECVDHLLKAGAKPEAPDAQGATAFMLACSGGFDEVARLLVQRHPTVDINIATEKFARRPIHQAAQSGHLSVVKLLIELRASIDLGEEDGATALWLACQDGHADVVELLARHGADIDRCTTSRQLRPIHQAALNGHLRIVRFLSDSGANLDGSEIEGATPLWMASQQGHSEIVELLLTKGANPNARVIKSSRSPLHQAVQNGHQAVAEVLLRHGADVNAAEEDGWPPLMLAAQQGYLEIAELLLANRADARLIAVNEASSLWIAAQQGHVRIAEALLRAGATALTCAKNGRMPVHQAAQNGHLEMVRLLIEHGSGIDCQSVPEGGITPLWLASQGGHDAIVEFLLEKGASVVIG